MKYQDLFSLKIKKKIKIMSSAAVVIGTLRVKKKITEGTEKKIMIKIKKKRKRNCSVLHFQILIVGRFIIGLKLFKIRLKSSGFVVISLCCF